METFAIKNFSLTNTEIKLGEMKRVQPCSKLKDKKPKIEEDEEDGIFDRAAFEKSLQIRNRFCKNNSVACV
jgi:tetrahydromethanopterin S-methyltransferase subunit H